MLDADEARWIVVAKRMQVHVELGYATFLEYLERGMARRVRRTSSRGVKSALMNAGYKASIAKLAIDAVSAWLGAARTLETALRAAFVHVHEIGDR